MDKRSASGAARDQAGSRESPFGGPIAHGFLTLSLLPEFAHQAYRVDAPFKHGVNYGLNRLLEVERREKPALVAEWVSRAYR